MCVLYNVAEKDNDLHIYLVSWYGNHICIACIYAMNNVGYLCIDMVDLYYRYTASHLHIQCFYFHAISNFVLLLTAQLFMFVLIGFCACVCLCLCICGLSNRLSTEHHDGYDNEYRLPQKLNNIIT